MPAGHAAGAAVPPAQNSPSGHGLHEEEEEDEDEDEEDEVEDEEEDEEEEDEEGKSGRSGGRETFGSYPAAFHAATAAMPSVFIVTTQH